MDGWPHALRAFAGADAPGEVARDLAWAVVAAVPVAVEPHCYTVVLSALLAAFPPWARLSD